MTGSPSRLLIPGLLIAHFYDSSFSCWPFILTSLPASESPKNTRLQHFQPAHSGPRRHSLHQICSAILFFAAPIMALTLLQFLPGFKPAEKCRRVFGFCEYIVHVGLLKAEFLKSAIVCSELFFSLTETDNNIGCNTSPGNIFLTFATSFCNLLLYIACSFLRGLHPSRACMGT